MSPDPTDNDGQPEIEETPTPHPHVVFTHGCAQCDHVREGIERTIGNHPSAQGWREPVVRADLSGADKVDADLDHLDRGIAAEGLWRALEDVRRAQTMSPTDPSRLDVMRQARAARKRIIHYVLMHQHEIDGDDLI